MQAIDKEMKCRPLVAIIMLLLLVGDSFCATRATGTLARAQRQTITGELATGLTGTGTR